MGFSARFYLFCVLFFILFSGGLAFQRNSGDDSGILGPQRSLLAYSPVNHTTGPGDTLMTACTNETFFFNGTCKDCDLPVDYGLIAVQIIGLVIFVLALPQKYYSRWFNTPHFGVLVVFLQVLVMLTDVAWPHSLYELLLRFFTYLRTLVFMDFEYLACIVNKYAPDYAFGTYRNDYAFLMANLLIGPLVLFIFICFFSRLRGQGKRGRAFWGHARIYMLIVSIPTLAKTVAMFKCVDNEWNAEVLKTMPWIQCPLSLFSLEGLGVYRLAAAFVCFVGAIFQVVVFWKGLNSNRPPRKIANIIRIRDFKKPFRLRAEGEWFDTLLVARNAVIVVVMFLDNNYDRTLLGVAGVYMFYMALVARLRPMKKGNIVAMFEPMVGAAVMATLYLADTTPEERDETLVIPQGNKFDYAAAGLIAAFFVVWSLSECVWRRERKKRGDRPRTLMAAQNSEILDAELPPKAEKKEGKGTIAEEKLKKAKSAAAAPQAPEAKKEENVKNKSSTKELVNVLEDTPKRKQEKKKRMEEEKAAAAAKQQEDKKAAKRQDSNISIDSKKSRSSRGSTKSAGDRRSASGDKHQLKEVMVDAGADAKLDDKKAADSGEKDVGAELVPAQAEPKFDDDQAEPRSLHEVMVEDPDGMQEMSQDVHMAIGRDLRMDVSSKSELVSLSNSAAPGESREKKQKRSGDDNDKGAATLGTDESFVSMPVVGKGPREPAEIYAVLGTPGYNLFDYLGSTPEGSPPAMVMSGQVSATDVMELGEPAVAVLAAAAEALGGDRETPSTEEEEPAEEEDEEAAGDRVLEGGVRINSSSGSVNAAYSPSEQDPIPPQTPPSKHSTRSVTPSPEQSPPPQRAPRSEPRSRKQGSGRRLVASPGQENEERQEKRSRARERWALARSALRKTGSRDRVERGEPEDRDRDSYRENRDKDQRSSRGSLRTSERERDSRDRDSRDRDSRRSHRDRRGGIERSPSGRRLHHSRHSLSRGSLDASAERLAVIAGKLKREQRGGGGDDRSSSRRDEHRHSERHGGSSRRDRDRDRGGDDAAEQLGESASRKRLRAGRDSQGMLNSSSQSRLHTTKDLSRSGRHREAVKRSGTFNVGRREDKGVSMRSGALAKILDKHTSELVSKSPVGSRVRRRAFDEHDVADDDSGEIEQFIEELEDFVQSLEVAGEALSELMASTQIKAIIEVLAQVIDRLGLKDVLLPNNEPVRLGFIARLHEIQDSAGKSLLEVIVDILGRSHPPTLRFPSDLPNRRALLDLAGFKAKLADLRSRQSSIDDQSGSKRVTQLVQTARRKHIGLRSQCATVLTALHEPGVRPESTSELFESFLSFCDVFKDSVKRHGR